MLFYLLLVAMLNLALGYALAVKWGHPRSATPPLAAPSPTEPDAVQPGPTAAEGVPALYDEPPPASEQPDATPDATPNVVGVDPEEVAATPTEDAKVAETEDAARRSHLEGNVDDFLHGLQRFHAKIAELDQSVRRAATNPTSDELRSCTEALREASNRYIAEVQHSLEVLAARQPGLTSLADVGHKVRKAVTKQADHLHAARGRLQELDLDDDINGSCLQLLDETNGLIGSAAQLQQQLEDARLEVARRENWLDQLGDEMLTDELTQIATRAALEAAILEQWQQDPERGRSQVVGLIDVDHCARINELHGREVCDNVLRAVAKIVSATAGDGTLVARFGGQKFAVLLAGATNSQAVSEVERVRQTLHSAQFTHVEDQIQVTASCALAVVKQEDTLESLFERLAHTLGESKQYGRNRTFLHEATAPTPVAPINLPIKADQYDV